MTLLKNQFNVKIAYNFIICMGSCVKIYSSIYYIGVVITKSKYYRQISKPNFGSILCLLH